MEDRAIRILDAMYDEIHFELNPSDEECFACGGEGETYDWIDGFCEDAESGSRIGPALAPNASSST